MLLDASVEQRTGIRRDHFRVVCSTLMLLLVASPTRAQQAAAQCSVELPVFDAQGNRLAFKITAVTPEGDGSLDLLHSSEPSYRVAISGDRLDFPRSLIGKRRIAVTLNDGRGNKIVRRIPLMACQQRNSLEHGTSDTGADVTTTTVTGRLAGCQLNDAWWIRVVPMFGGLEDPIIHDGFIRATDGEFWVTSSFEGERHIVIIGKAKDPVKSIGVNVLKGGRNDLGTVNLGGLCPR